MLSFVDGWISRLKKKLNEIVIKPSTIIVYYYFEDKNY